MENRENSEPGIWGTLWPRIDPWTIIVRAVVLIVIGSWVMKGYTFFLTWRVKRTIKHCQIKENFNEFKQVRSEAAVHTQQPRRKSRKFNRRAVRTPRKKIEGNVAAQRPRCPREWHGHSLPIFRGREWPCKAAVEPRYSPFCQRQKVFSHPFLTLL